jgi:AraC family transcriptional regulator
MMGEQQGNIYLQRINLVADYVREHPAGDLSVHTLARVAGFSPFHFHRVFTCVTGEPVNRFVSRLRLERAAALLKSAPEMRVIDAALACGFASASSFSRAFKKRFGVSARSWDRQGPLKDSKDGQLLEGFPHYNLDVLDDLAAGGEFEVRLRSLPARQLAYIRVLDSYRPGRVTSAYDRLVEWFVARGGDPAHTGLIGMSQDDPDVTPLALCRYDLCLQVPEGWGAEGEVSVRPFPACHIAYIHCRGDIFLVDRAWQYLYRYWLPRSSFVPDNLPAMEIFRRQPAELGWEEYDLDCAIPIVRP